MGNFYPKKCLKISRICSIQILFLAMSILICLPIKAASHRLERRIYLLDVTLSMKGFNNSPNIYKRVINALTTEVSSISDPSTEIVILPFQDKVLGCFSAKATEAGKDRLIKQVCNFNYADTTYTNLFLPIKYAKKNFIKNDRRNLLFLLTDGCHNDPKTSINLFKRELCNWGIYSKGNDAYAFYVLLTNEAEPSDDIKKIIKETDRLDMFSDPGKLQFVMVQMPSEIKINLEDDHGKRISIKLISDKEIPEGARLRLELNKNPNFRVDQECVVKNNMINLDLQLLHPYDSLKMVLPVHEIIPMKTKLVNGENIQKCTGKRILYCAGDCPIDIINKPEKTLKISIVEN